MCGGVHLHVHCEESVLDGLSTVEELVLKAKSLGQTAIALTDHGVMGAIPDFIKACETHKIKPVPGCEVYMTRNRLVRAEERKQMRIDLCKSYKITDNKGKPKLKLIGDFLGRMRKKPWLFDEEAPIILRDFLMGMDTDMQEQDLFTIYDEVEVSLTVDDKINQFRQDVYEYLDHGNFHMVLLATSNKGLEDLYEITSDAHINGFYGDPRTDLSYIRERGLGNDIIATSACLGSFFSKLVLAGRLDDARKHIQECKDTFKEFYLEKQANRNEEQDKVNAIIDQLAIETNTPKILTTDVHYANKEDVHIHDVLVASSTGKCVTDTDRMTYDPEYWMKNDEEMMEKCYDPEAWANTLKIAEQVNVSLPKAPLFPLFPVDGNETTAELLAKKAWAGLYSMALTENIDIPTYSKRLQYELDVINAEGFADYFLITEDKMTATKNAGFLLGPGRGSGAGSLVCRVLEITMLDPIKENLLFERFLNPERAGYPDLDVDYSYDGAAWVQQYLKRKYGHDRVAQIGTKGTLAARAVCRRVGKTLGYDNAVQDAFAKAIPDKPGIKLAKAFKEEPMVQQYATAYPEWWEGMLKLEGHVSQVGTHAGGIVLSPVPLTKVTPLRIDSDGLETTQYDMKWIENFLVKFDVLKIDTLDLVKKTMEYAGLWGSMNVYRDIDVNDPLIYEKVYQALNLSGIFQCESDLFHKIIDDMKPTSFGDISVIVALGRPGPLDLIPTYVARKWGREKVTYPFQELEPVLGETYGVWVYQEQIMQASRILGGLTLGQADMIRKGVSKKKHDLMSRWIDLMIYGSEKYKIDHEALVAQYPLEQYPKTASGDNHPDIPVWVDYDYKKVPDIEGALNRGFGLDTLLQIKKDWIKFGDYCFNKAHSAAYAYLSCITAYFKCYYPAQFMAALMTISEGKKDKNKKPKNIHYIRECESMGIQIMQPDVNKSMSGWTPVVWEQPMLNEDGETFFAEIRYGLNSIAGISGESVNEIINNRPYSSVEDMIAKTNGTKVNKTKVEALIKSGSFDSINKNRNLLLRNYMASRHEDYEQIPETTTKAAILTYERECFGIAISLRSKWEKLEDGATTQITGTVHLISEWTAKSSGKKHYTVQLQTREEMIEVTVWGFHMLKNEDKIRIGNKVTIKGEKNREKLQLNSVTLVEDVYLEEKIQKYTVDLPQ